MSKRYGRTHQKYPLAIKVAILGAIATLLAALIGVIGPMVPQIIKNIHPPPTPSCISSDDILITFHILNNSQVIAEVSSGETVFLTPDTHVYIKPEIKSASNSVLPQLECQWTNTGIATDGILLHSAGCNLIDYQSGHTYIQDAIAVQLSQQSCPSFPPYSLFIMPKP